MFTTKVRTLDNTRIFLVLNHFHVKLRGLNLCFTEHQNYAAPVNYLKTKFGSLKCLCSGNGFPRTIRNLLISKLKNKFSTDRPRTNFFDENDTRPKVWVRVPYLGKQGETLVKNCIKKIQRCLTVPVNFIVIYDNKKFSYFLSNKDKIPNLSKSSVVYEVTCPGCSATYIGKTERRLQTRLAEHTNPTKSAIGQHFHNCEHVQYIVNLHFAFDKLNNPTDADNNVSTFISNLIIDNSRILHIIYSRTPNFLLLLEALYIKYHSPSLNTGLKASKELKLFS
jgi:hypothetical protein